MISDFSQAVYDLLKQIPPGKVTTYSALAKRLGRPQAARAVGNILNKNPYAPQAPCHRVVKNDGKVGGFASGTKKKVELLKKEGLEIQEEKIVDFRNKLYIF